MIDRAERRHVDRGRFDRRKRRQIYRWLKICQSLELGKRERVGRKERGW